MNNGLVHLILTVEEARQVANLLTSTAARMTDFREADDAARLRRVAALIRVELDHPMDGRAR